MSSSNCCFLTCIQVSQDTGQVVWYSHLFQNFPWFIVIHTVEGFGIVSNVFLVLSCFFCNPAIPLLGTSSVQFSCSVVSDSLRPHELQHARPSCPSPTPGFHPNYVHLVGDAIQPSHPLSSPFPPAPNPSQHQSLF